jgi:hypothetical protein
MLFKCCNKVVALLDIVGAIRQRMEVLAAMDKLKQLGKELVDEFHDVFAPILHIDDLPMDVYC